LAKNPDKSVAFAVKELELKPIKLSELKEIAKSIVTPDMPFEKALGLVMSKVRGRIEAKEVMKVVKKLLK
jgi:Glu-tRNA(Gln) amidotransferase subunit E-like FAD-binding protein